MAPNIHNIYIFARMNRESYLWEKELNSAQLEAVKNFNGASLIIAGAGSGKTRVIAYRIANMLQQGVSPSSILALTFTNKAATEMKERISHLVGASSGRRVWMGTFHSIFIRFLREYAHLLGFSSNFSIYDVSNSKSVYKQCVKELDLDPKLYKPSLLYSRISFAKNNLIGAQAYNSSAQLRENDAKSRVPKVGEVYELYSKKCRQAEAMDFDDILLYTNILFRDFPDALKAFQQRFNYILVDEYQDTNYAQYLIIKKLGLEHRNICVVGDDSQSIYAFRGARIENILNFNRDFPEAVEYRLEQNYRSTQMIVNAANTLIAKNSAQLKKECYSKGKVGDRVKIWDAPNDNYEAEGVAERIKSTIYKEGLPFNTFAVLYRTNAQSRVLEESFRRHSIPYKLYGGFSFYQYSEVQDLIAYFRLLVNPHDNEAFRRVVNRPTRKIGETTIGRLAAFAAERNVSLWEGVSLLKGNEEHHSIRSTTAKILLAFCEVIEGISHRVATTDAYQVAMEIYHASGYAAWLKSDNSIEGESRIRNIEELFNSIASFIEETQNSEEMVESEGEEQQSFEESLSLSSFLEKVSLISAVDSMEEDLDEGSVTLMTIHSAKGLEFENLFVVGCEENLFPSGSNNFDTKEEEEERRLMYVAITRAKERLWLSCAGSRFSWGNTVYNPPSRFLREIDEKFVELSPSIIYKLKGARNAPATSSPAERVSENRFKTVSTRSGVVKRPPNPNFRADHYSKFRVGQKIEHDRFGFGTILMLEGNELNTKVIVEFEEGGKKTLLLKFAKIRVV